MRTEAHVKLGATDVHILGTIAGFVPDAARVQTAFLASPPALVALGIPPEDLPALKQLTEAPSGIELDLLDESDVLLHKHLERFGAVRIPSPDLESAYRLATSHGVPLHAIDLDDEAHSGLFTRLVKVRHLVRANRRRAKAFKADLAHIADPHELVAHWDAALAGEGPHAEVEAQRERHMAARLRELAQAQGPGTVAVQGGEAVPPTPGAPAPPRRILAILPIARLAGVVRALGGQA